MNSKRTYFALLGVIGILFVAIIGILFVGNSFLKKQANVLYQKKLENALLDKQQSALVKANKEMPSYQELESVAKSIVPQDKDQAKAVRELVTIAQKNSVTIKAINFPNSTLGTAAPKTSTTGTGTTKTAEGTPTTPQAPPLTQTKSVAGIPGVYQLDIIVQSDEKSPITYAQLTEFLHQLEVNQRTSQVSSISITPDSKDPKKLSFNLTVTVYVKP